uniref:Copper oxidase n=1 Tax=OCS116 cluster bacterium TaxID=2030921 RepID=A0A2A4Z1R4_9PROT
MVSRREFLVGSAALGVAGMAAYATPLAKNLFLPPKNNYILTAQQSEWGFGGHVANPAKIFSYQKNQPVPLIRMQQGQSFRALLKNHLAEPTTIHWHGIRLPNAMDGVPYLTQEPVYPNEEFTYQFTPKDAGTYFYHSHFNSLAQLGQGLAGMIIIDEEKKPDFDHDIALNLRDWRLDAAGKYQTFLEPKTAAKAGTFGQLKTANWQVKPHYNVKPNSLVRLRILVSDVTRIFKLIVRDSSNPEAKAKIIAIDGNPIEDIRDMGREWIGPGMRMDIAILMPDEGQTVELVNTSTNKPWVVARLNSQGVSQKRVWQDLKPLPQNPIAPLNLKGAEIKKFEFSASSGEQENLGINCAASDYIFWAINKVAIGHLDPNSSSMRPTASLKLGKTYIFEFTNVTPQTHPIHLHGFFFRVLSSSKRKIIPHWADTSLIRPKETVRVAFNADTVGNWLMHCHILEHQKTGMTGFINVS